jgi:seipin
VLKPLSYATSKPAQRAYLSTALFLVTSIFLLGIAITAYIFFYFSYIPTRGFSRPVYLQFGPNQHPYGIATLSRELVSNQPYDVKAVLHMPRTPSNIEAGNFMLDLQLLAPGAPGGVWSSAKGEVLLQETRPAILTYHSKVMDHVHKAAALPLYVLGLREEAESLDVKLMEGVEFARGWKNIPAMARLELQSEHKLQVYDAKIVFIARLKGLRLVIAPFSFF